MAGSASMPDQAFHVRSNSLPSRSHPIAVRVDEELHRLRTCAASSTSSVTPQLMCSHLQGLGDMYDCINELLCLPCSQQDLTHPHQKKFVEAELDGSIRLLDLCAALRDNLDMAKQHIQDMQFTLRRKDAALESKQQTYIRSRKKAENDIKNCFKSLKQMGKCGSYATFDKDCERFLVDRVFAEAREITISLLHSISSFMSMSMPRQKSSRWSFVSKAMQKRKLACEPVHEDGNEVGSLDVDHGRVQKVQCQLETLEAYIQDLENGLECLFRRLIRNRVSLLNILSL